MRSFRILFHTHSNTAYGANRSMLGLAIELKRRGYIVTILCPFREGSIQRLAQQNGLKIINFPTPWSCSPLNPTLKQFIRILLQRFMSVVILPFLVYKYKVLKCDLIVTNSSVLSVSAIAAKLCRIPHFWYFREFVDIDFGLRFDLPVRLQNYLWRGSLRRIAISKAVAQHFQRNFKSPNCVIIYNGILTENELYNLRLKYVPREFNPNSQLALGVLGRISKSKGQYKVIEALKFLNKNGLNAMLNIFGSGDRQSELYCRNMAKSLDVEVKFHGFCDNPFEAMKNIDILIVPSDAEAFGRVTLEGMLAAKVVIAVANGGSLELVKDGENGLLYDGSVEGLVKTIYRLTLSPSLFFDLAKNGQDFAQNFSFEACANSFEFELSNLSKVKSL